MGTYEPVVEKPLSRPALSEEAERVEQEESALPDTALQRRGGNDAVAALKSWTAMAATAATPAAAALSDDAINRLVHALR